MRKKFSHLPKEVKTRIIIIGLIISILIGFAVDDYDFYFEEEFFTPLVLSFIIYFIIAFFISADVYEGLYNLKNWIKRAIFGGGLLLSALFGLFSNEFYIDEDFFIPFTLSYIGIFIVASVSIWIYNSYKNE